MANNISFHTDENCHEAIGAGLRRRGFDVTTTSEADLRGRSDEDQLQFAASQGRVLITHDADFLRLHQQGYPHTGIAYCRQGDRSIGEILRSLIRIAELLTPEEMNNHVEFL